MILAAEANPEWRAYYELLWHLGGPQSDTANLQAEDIDWSLQLISYRRAKTDNVALVRFGERVAEILRSLPAQGPLFPMLGPWKESDRAKAFIRRCKLAGVSGVSLHSYRYAWAERAKDRRHARALRHGKPGPQIQSRAPCLRQKGPGQDPLPGGIRTKTPGDFKKSEADLFVLNTQVSKEFGTTF